MEGCRGFPVFCFWHSLELQLVKVMRQAVRRRATVGDTCVCSVERG